MESIEFQDLKPALKMERIFKCIFWLYVVFGVHDSTIGVFIGKGSRDLSNGTVNVASELANVFVSSHL